MKPIRRTALSGLTLILLGGTIASAASGGPRGLAAVDQAIRDLGSTSVVLCLAARPGAVDADTLAYLRMKQGARAVAVVARWEMDCGMADECAGLWGSPSLDDIGRVRKAAGNLGIGITALDRTGEGFDRESAVEELVRLIREVKPDTVITRHTAGQACPCARGMRLAGEEAFRLAGDPDAFPEQVEEGLAPWQPVFFFERTHWPTNPSLSYDAMVPVWEYDPVRGASYTELALETWPAGEGCLQAMRAAKAEGIAYYRLVLPEPTDESPMGILPGENPAGILEECLSGARAKRAARSWDEAVRDLAETDLDERSRLLRHLEEAADALDALQASMAYEPESATCAAGRGVDLDTMKGKLGRAAAAVLGLDTRLVEAPAKIYPGAEFEVATETRAWWVGDLAYHVRAEPSPGVALAGSEFGEAELSPAGEKAGMISRNVFHFAVPPDVEFQPMAHGPGDTTPPVEAARIVTRFMIGGKGGREFSVETPVLARRVAPVRVEVVPESPVFLFSTDRDSMLQVEVTNNTDRSWPRSVVALRPPDGFTITRQEVARLTLLPGETATIAYWVRPVDAAPGVQPFRGMAVYGLEEGQTYREAEPGQVKTDLAQMKIPMLDIAPPAGEEVAIVRNCGGVLEGGLRSLDVPFHLLEAGDIASASLDRWNVIMIEPGAYGERPEVARHYTRFLRYLWRGGHLVVFGQCSTKWRSPYAPFPLDIGGALVTPEESGLTFLQPDHPLLTSPNQLAPEDFTAWKGPWGRYFGMLWSERYTPLLSAKTSDGLDEIGGLLVADYGYGSYVYVGLDLLQQVKTGDAGAYRLLANLIAYRDYRVRKTEPQTEEDPG